MANEKLLIDANALLARLASSSESWAKNLQAIRNWWPHAVGIKDNIVSLIKEAPTVDAVEVVRCKDCKHYVQFLQDNKECRCTIFSGCYDRPYPTEPDDFCSYGERREGE